MTDETRRLTREGIEHWRKELLGWFEEEDSAREINALCDMALRSEGEYVSVPREPTKVMIAAANTCYWQLIDGSRTMSGKLAEQDAKVIWRATLSAAPPAPNREAEDAKVDAAAWVYRYGTHRTSCSWRKPPQSNFQKQVCDCGLDELKKRVRTIYTESKHD